jgi:hypothetical protein
MGFHNDYHPPSWALHPTYPNKPERNMDLDIRKRDIHAQAERNAVPPNEMKIAG